MDKFSYKNTPLGKAFTKAQDNSGKISSAGEKSDVVTRRYKSAFIEDKTGAKAYMQYDKATNKVRFQFELSSPVRGKVQKNTGWINPDSDMENKTNAKLGRAISKLGDRKELDPKEKIYLRTVAATMATA